MAKGRVVAIVLEDAEKRGLTALTRKHWAPQSLAERARIVLAASSGLNNKEIAAKVGVCELLTMVNRWLIKHYRQFSIGIQCSVLKSSIGLVKRSVCNGC